MFLRNFLSIVNRYIFLVILMLQTRPVIFIGRISSMMKIM